MKFGFVVQIKLIELTTAVGNNEFLKEVLNLNLELTIDN